MALRHSFAVATLAMLIVPQPAAAARWIKRVETRTPLVTEPGERALPPISLDIKVDAKGGVTAVRPTDDAPADIVPILEQAIIGWHFAPAKRGGTPIDWATRLTAYLTAVPAGEGYSLKVRDISVQSVWLDPERPMVAPDYPGQARRLRQEGDALVLAMPNDDGKGAKILTVLFDGRTASRNDPLAKSSREAVSHWPYQVLHWDGQSYPEPVCAPINYSLDGGSRSTRNDKAKEAEQKRLCEAMEVEDAFTGIELLDELVGSRL